MEKNYLTYYELLEIPTNADGMEIESAYKNAAKKFHPDKQGGNDSSHRLFQYLNEAREVLIDPVKRKQYDELIGVLPRPIPTPQVVYKDRIVMQPSNNGNTKNLIAIGILGLLVGVAISGGSKSK